MVEDLTRSTRVAAPPSIRLRVIRFWRHMPLRERKTVSSALSLARALSIVENLPTFSRHLMDRARVLQVRLAGKRFRIFDRRISIYRAVYTDLSKITYHIYIYI